MPALASRVLSRSFSSLSVYNYRLYFTGQVVSLIGTWMQTTAQAWVVLQITGSAAALGIVVTLQFLPITLLTLVSGVIADRVPKRTLLTVAIAIQCSQAVILGTLVATGLVQVWHIYILAVFLGIANAIDSPVRQSFAVELVGKDQLVNAVALNSMIFNIARILGPAVAGIVIALVGPALAFFLNAASYSVNLIALRMMRPAEFRSVPQPRRGSVLSQLGEGFGYVFRTPSILLLFVVLAFMGTFGFNFMVIVPLVAEFVLGVGPERFGLLTSFLGAGSLVAAFVMAGLNRRDNRIMFGAAIAFVTLLGLIAVTTEFWISGLFFFVLGIVSLTFSTTINSSIQLAAPDHLRGRVMSIFVLLSAGSTPIGGSLTGLIADHTSVPIALLANASLCAMGLCIAGLFYLFQRRRAGHTTAQPLAEATLPG